MVLLILVYSESIFCKLLENGGKIIAFFCVTINIQIQRGFSVHSKREYNSWNSQECETFFEIGGKILWLNRFGYNLNIFVSYIYSFFKYFEIHSMKLCSHVIHSLRRDSQVFC